jgi:hypothetical protein
VGTGAVSTSDAEWDDVLQATNVEATVGALLTSSHRVMPQVVV